MLRATLLIAVVALAAPTQAGCWSAEEHPDTAPQRAVICVKGKCRTTALQSYCANAFSAAASYSNGLTIHREEGNDTITVNDKPVRWKSVTCKEVDEGTCDLFEFKLTGQ